MYVAEARGVEKRYGQGAGEVAALGGVSVGFPPGSFAALAGPSGSGKTTLLNMFGALDVPTSGEVRIEGQSLASLSESGLAALRARSIGFIFQSFNLIPVLSAAENVALALQLSGRPFPDAKDRVEAMLAAVGLGGLGDRRPSQLSGGQQQRVALARALAVQPEVLLLDEPLSALDARVRSNLRDEIKRIQRETGITTLFVTHDQDEALAMSDRVGVMSNGRLEQVGTPHDVYQSPASPFVARFVGSINEIPTAAGTILVRPEALEIHDDVARGRWVGTVVASTFQGPSTLIDVRLDVVDSLARVHTVTGTYTGSPGDRVSISMLGEHLLADR